MLHRKIFHIEAAIINIHKKKKNTIENILQMKLNTLVNINHNETQASLIFGREAIYQILSVALFIFCSISARSSFLFGNTIAKMIYTTTQVQKKNNETTNNTLNHMGLISKNSHNHWQTQNNNHFEGFL